MIGDGGGMAVGGMAVGGMAAGGMAAEQQQQSATHHLSVQHSPLSILCKYVLLLAVNKDQ